MHKFAKDCAKGCSIGYNLDSLTIQKIATRAHDAVSKYLYRVRGKPRFKRVCKNSKTHRLRSVEGKNNASGIRFIDGQVIWNVRGSEKLILSPRFDSKDKYGLEKHALSCKVKYVRIVKKLIGKKHRFVAQLVLAGTPKLKRDNSLVKDKIVGIDVGPSSIAIYSQQEVLLKELCPDIDYCVKKISTLQRKMDRSRRATNINNYNSDKTIKKGPKVLNLSNSYLKMQMDKQILENKIKLARAHSHGELANKILSLGNILKVEKTSYKGWQKVLFGQSVQKKAPGMLKDILQRKAETANGKVIEINTYATKLSQTCICSKIQKKKLSQRWHECTDCNTTAQRDVFSAYLAYYVEDNSLDICQSKKDWPGAKVLHDTAISRLRQRTSGKEYIASFGLAKGKRQSSSQYKDNFQHIDALDVVA